MSLAAPNERVITAHRNTFRAVYLAGLRASGRPGVRASGRRPTSRCTRSGNQKVAEWSSTAEAGEMAAWHHAGARC